MSRRGDRNMKEKQVKLLGPDRPIAIERNPAGVVVSVAGRVVARPAETKRPIQLHMRKKDKQESLMVSQCANPDCRRELRYLRDGRIYGFAMSAGNGSKSLEHFWLCGECSKKWV